MSTKSLHCLHLLQLAILKVSCALRYRFVSVLSSQGSSAVTNIEDELSDSDDDEVNNEANNVKLKAVDIVSLSGGKFY